MEQERVVEIEDDESGSRDGVWRCDVVVEWRCDLITDCQTKTVLLVYVFELQSTPLSCRL